MVRPNQSKSTGRKYKASTYENLKKFAFTDDERRDKGMLQITFITRSVSCEIANHRDTGKVYAIGSKQ